MAVTRTVIRPKIKDDNAPMPINHRIKRTRTIKQMNRARHLLPPRPPHEIQARKNYFAGTAGALTHGLTDPHFLTNKKVRASYSSPATTLMMMTHRMKMTVFDPLISVQTGSTCYKNLIALSLTHITFTSIHAPPTIK